MEQKEVSMTALKAAAKGEVVSAIGSVVTLNQIGSSEFAVETSNGQIVKIAITAADMKGTKATDKREARAPFVLADAVAKYEAEVAEKAAKAAADAAAKAAKTK